MYELHTLGYQTGDIGKRVDHAHVDQLLSVRIRDTTSWLFAAVNGWEHPVSRDWIIAADQYDTFVRANSKRKVQPYPRPWRDANKTRLGDTKLTPMQARDLLTRARTEGVGEAIAVRPTYA